MQQYGIQALQSLVVHDHSNTIQGGNVPNSSINAVSSTRFYRTANQADIVTNVWTKILWDAEEWDIGGDFNANGVDSDFLVRFPGIHLVYCIAGIMGFNADDIHEFQVYLDGAGLGRTLALAQGSVANGEYQPFSTFVNATVGQVIDIRVRHQFGANRDLDGGRGDCYGGIHFLGRA